MKKMTREEFIMSSITKLGCFAVLVFLGCGKKERNITCPDISGASGTYTWREG